ncbi:HAMP domain-containing histidine kinase [Lujinxingia vulgaris]|uniref:histidine kinase n=1 Tax=Lujinxingia vulgaris TaxID=2600176 RepID=A0A5C6X2D2_9DELT|nr:HAMP domain-containing sensor histidine kinase [Lujinxingia vulgaris]TXD35982.1 HAMP domain-containing histidine kinase [Lujinxingia vulgaris]
MRVRASLRAQMIAAFVVPTTLIIVAMIGLAWASAQRGLEEEVGRRLIAIGGALSAELSEGIDAAQLGRMDASMERVRARLSERLEATRQATDARRVMIVDSELKSLVDTDVAVSFGQPVFSLEADRMEIARSFEDGEARTSPMFRTDDGQRHKKAFVPVWLDDEPVAMIVVIASATHFELLGDFGGALVALGGVGVAVVGVVAVLFAAALLRPVRRLVSGVERVAQGELSRPLVSADQPAAGPEEIAFLMGAFEEMRQSVVARDARMQMMLAGIAHEVRNPLGGMKLFCGLLHEELRDAGEDEQVVMVEKIARELNYLERVVTDFLAYARPTELVPERFEAAGVLAAIEDLLRGEMAEVGCVLKVEGAQEVVWTGDVSRLRRAILNVVRNAYQASPPGECVRVVVGDEGGVCRVEVMDRGAGIAPEKLAELSTPFFTTREKGSGLGLALTRQILEEHGGSLHIASEPGQGTCVVLSWPFDGSLPEVPKAQAVPEGWLG